MYHMAYYASVQSMIGLDELRTWIYSFLQSRDRGKVMQTKISQRMEKFSEEFLPVIIIS